MPKIFNDPKQKNLRRKLRQQPIACEKILWLKPRNRKLGGYKFRRQAGIGKYVVDFYCSEACLVVEIDGATHCSEEELENDKERQKFIENKGLRVKRYLNVDVKGDLELVLEDILRVCKERL